MAFDLDVYKAAHTAPKQSYDNPAEQVMSKLNLGLQNVATSRESMELAKETRIKSLRTLDKIRELQKETLPQRVFRSF